MTVHQSQINTHELLKRVALLEAELKAEKAAKAAKADVPPVRIDKYGNVCVGGFRHRADNWLSVLARSEEILSFIADNEAEIAKRREASK